MKVLRIMGTCVLTMAIVVATVSVVKSLGPGAADGLMGATPDCGPMHMADCVRQLEKAVHTLPLPGDD